MKILKLSAPFNISPLTYIGNKSLYSGVFPKRLKYAIIKPVYKKGDKFLAKNYRPVSLLTSFSKILKKLIYSRLYKHICCTNILVKEQYGFRINSSTEAASYNVIKNPKYSKPLRRRPIWVRTDKVKNFLIHHFRAC